MAKHKKHSNSRWFDDKIRCGKCGVIKPTTDFYKNASRVDGYSGQCKDCEKLYPPRKKTGNGQSKAKRGNQRRNKLSNPMKSWLDALFNSYKKEAKRKKRVFELTIEQVKYIATQPCVYCGGFSTTSKINGIDRIDSSKGYVQGNCASCCSMCNRMKFTYDIDTFISHVFDIVKYLSKK